MKGIVLAGGSGSRLYPLSAATSKQLMPVYDKPMIYYPVSTLMLAGIRDILIVCSPRHTEDFKRVLGNGTQLGVQFSYIEQPEPKGIADALILGENFIAGQSVALILGDNLFYGMGLGEALREKAITHTGAKVFCQEVRDPARYGVIELDTNGRVLSLEEKPAIPKSNLASTGLYFFDNRASTLAKTLEPSERGELEISDLLKLYLAEGLLSVEVLERGVVWLDTGTVDSLASASEFVRVVQERQNVKIGAPEEIAWRLGFISNEEFRVMANELPSSSYKEYLVSLSPNRDESTSSM
jgi:glucose-1-phosphate thymidylyltransferase